nr:LysR family transcriptional regulator [Pseudomonas sp. RIT-PI-S]
MPRRLAGVYTSVELRHLRYFIAVAEERHITRAAARLNMQQPPLSQQIRALEQELGFELFRRHPKGVDLTAAGHRYLGQVRDILARLQAAAEEGARIAAGLEGTLSVCFTSSAAAHPLTSLAIRAYRKAYPGVSVRLEEGSAQAVTERMIEQQVDVGFLRAPVAEHPALAFHHLLDEPLLLVLPIDHPLLGHSPVDEAGMPAIALADLAQAPFILVRRPGAPGMYADLLDACRRAGFEAKVAFEVERMLTNVNLVAAGEGVSVVPASMQNLLAGSVRYCSLRDVQPPLVAPLTLVARMHQASPAACHFVELAKRLSRNRMAG